eukprot:3026018-Prymnesium_polylepis.1
MGVWACGWVCGRAGVVCGRVQGRAACAPHRALAHRVDQVVVALHHAQHVVPPLCRSRARLAHTARRLRAQQLLQHPK